MLDHTVHFALVQIWVERIEKTLKLYFGVDWPDVNFICQRQTGITLGPVSELGMSPEDFAW